MEPMNDGGGVPIAAHARRHAMLGLAAACGGLTLGSVKAWAETEAGISHSEESIHQEIVLKANRMRVYGALLDADQFDKVAQRSAAMQSGMASGKAPTQIDRAAGGAFLLFDGHILGRNIELVPNERIVQAWRVVNWGPGVYSIAKFELVEQGSQTKIVFDHTGFPKGQAEHLAAGWRGNYWEPLAKFLT